MPADNFRAFLEQESPSQPDRREAWQTPRDEYCRVYQDDIDRCQREIDYIYQSYAPEIPMPQADNPYSRTWSDRARMGDWEATMAMNRQKAEEVIAQRRLRDRMKKAKWKLVRLQNDHKRQVREAVKKGLPVPPEVLKDYSRKA